MALDVRMKNGFQVLSFEYNDVLDSYFIHRYIIRVMWPLISVCKMVSGQYLLNIAMYWIHISYTGILSINTGQVDY